MQSVLNHVYGNGRETENLMCSLGEIVEALREELQEMDQLREKTISLETQLAECLAVARAECQDHLQELELLRMVLAEMERLQPGGAHNPRA